MGDSLNIPVSSSVGELREIAISVPDFPSGPYVFGTDVVFSVGSSVETTFDGSGFYLLRETRFDGSSARQEVKFLLVDADYCYFDGFRSFVEEYTWTDENVKCCELVMIDATNEKVFNIAREVYQTHGDMPAVMNVTSVDNAIVRLNNFAKNYSGKFDIVIVGHGLPGLCGMGAGSSLQKGKVIASSDTYSYKNKDGQTISVTHDGLKYATKFAEACNGKVNKLVICGCFSGADDAKLLQEMANTGDMSVEALDGPTWWHKSGNGSDTRLLFGKHKTYNWITKEPSN